MHRREFAVNTDMYSVQYKWKVFFIITQYH